MMDLDEMKVKWAEQDRKIEVGIRLNRQMLGTMRPEPGRYRLWLSLALWLIYIVALGEFIYDHLATPQFAIAAVAIDVYSIGCLIALIRQITMLAAIDWGQPVAVSQRQLEAVRRLRIRTTQWAILAGAILWAPFAIVLAQAILGIDLYHLFGAKWLAANVLFGLVLVASGVWLTKKLGNHRIMDDLAGRSLNEAARFLASLSEFEQG